MVTAREAVSVCSSDCAARMSVKGMSPGAATCLQSQMLIVWEINSLDMEQSDG
jgi:hypothetical protein